MPSDELVKAMDSIYQTNLHPNSMRPADKEELYAELYLNIDWASSRVHLNEKDPDYRTAVIHALAGSAG